MGTKRNVDMSTSSDTVKIVENESTLESSQGTESGKKVTKERVRSKKYSAARAHVDKTRIYDVFAAVELIKKLSYTHFAGTITADGVVREIGEQGVITFPHSTGATLRVAIVNEEVLSQIQAGNLDFDVLVTEPKFMPQLAKHARVLGPKGLMPNPKAGTVTPNPELKKKELESGKMTIKSERKSPVIHLTIGKTDMDTKALVENITQLLTILKGKLRKLSISATMSPAVKVEVELPKK